MSVLVRCWGDYACFTRPEMKADRVSYDVMTPSAARGIMEAIYWHPGITWNIQKIWVRKPINFVNIRRNELKNIMGSTALVSAITTNSMLDVCDTNGQHTLRASTILTDVEYYIQAYVNVDEQKCCHSAQTVNAIIMKRLCKGKCYHRPYFGCREFPAHFELASSVSDCPSELMGRRDLSWMLWDLDYPGNGKQPKPLFFRPIMVDGLIEVPKKGDFA